MRGSRGGPTGVFDPFDFARIARLAVTRGLWHDLLHGLPVLDLRPTEGGDGNRDSRGCFIPGQSDRRRRSLPATALEAPAPVETSPLVSFRAGTRGRTVEDALLCPNLAGLRSIDRRCTPSKASAFFAAGGFETHTYRP